MNIHRQKYILPSHIVLPVTSYYTLHAVHSLQYYKRERERGGGGGEGEGIIMRCKHSLMHSDTHTVLHIIKMAAKSLTVHAWTHIKALVCSLKIF